MRNTSSFDLAAHRVQERFFRRFPHARRDQATISDIKWRWYRSRITWVKRERLGKE